MEAWMMPGSQEFEQLQDLDDILKITEPQGNGSL